MTRTRAARGAAVVAVALVAALVAAPSATPGTPERGVEPAPEVEPRTFEVEDPARLVRDLSELEDAWAVGGGRFGYPFWEKAGQRWRTGQLATTIYREYVTGYRDRLEAGCELLDAVRARTEASRAVRELTLAACRSRVSAVRAQQRWLDVELSSTIAPPEDPAGRAELDAAAAEHEAEFRDQLQRSYRDARLALELAQESLRQVGRDPLAEDAFI